jgi:hypothetical protein
MNEIVALQDIERAGSYIAKSGLFGVKTPEQAIALMLVAQAEGRNPFEAARDYHIIQGRPALKADSILARFQQAGGSVRWIELSDTKAVAEFSHPQGGKVTIDWDIDRAKRAGLLGKDNWRNYPRQMLRARVISEGVRTIYPGVCVGTYTVEEVQDMSEIKPTGEQEYTFIDTQQDTLQATQQATEQATEQETAQAAPPKPADWDELALKNRAKEIINEKAILEITQKRLWKDSGHDWAKFIELLEQEPDPIF